MKFSVIMPSMLSDYPNAAVNRDQKLTRAINSVLEQSFKDFELIVISDGCDLTTWLVKKIYRGNKTIRLLRTERDGLWSNAARNKGLEVARGQYIIYLDNDDYYGPDHLSIFDRNIKGHDWVYSSDWVRRKDEWIERPVDTSQYGKCGTSNICHLNKLQMRWTKTGYGHDYHFIQQLRKRENNLHIETAQYYVCHIGGVYCI